MQDFEELTCRICSDLLLYPVTLSCGHSFCKYCLQQKFDHTSLCPTCKKCLHIDPYLAMPSVVLESIIEEEFPHEIQRRRQNAQPPQNIKRYIPLFVLNCPVYPGKSAHFHIFEPRYRLLLRRTLLGSGRFGILGETDMGLETIGVALFVDESELMRDGCSLSKAVGAERFRLKEYYEMNGYLVAEVEYFQDEPIPPEKLNECKALFTRLELLCDNFATANYCMDIEILLHDRPMIFKSADDVTIENSPYVERYSMWLASFLPLGDELRQYIFSLVDTTKRLEVLYSLYTIATTFPEREITLSAAAPTA